MPSPDPLLERVHRALDETTDPCSVGRGVPAGLRDMGMVVRADVIRDAGTVRVDVVLRLTSPACTFQLYFDDRLRARLAAIDGIDAVAIEWSERFDWSDDDMSDALKGRLREKRDRLLAARR